MEGCHVTPGRKAFGLNFLLGAGTVFGLFWEADGGIFLPADAAACLDSSSIRTAYSSSASAAASSSETSSGSPAADLAEAGSSALDVSMSFSKAVDAAGLAGWAVLAAARLRFVCATRLAALGESCFFTGSTDVCTDWAAPPISSGILSVVADDDAESFFAAGAVLVTGAEVCPSAAVVAGTVCGADAEGTEGAEDSAVAGAGETGAADAEAAGAESAVPATFCPEVCKDSFNKSILEDGASTAVETRNEEEADDVGAACPHICPENPPTTANNKIFFMRARTRYNSTLAPEELSLISYSNWHCLSVSSGDPVILAVTV